ncbi:hypothetical protein GSI_13078 [Ganoderma sinense ZZ0214-1]|uniref:RING-type domain-containing protein n=1 Tax=Ganoderma sinense ZZ0214-1 TaxID=1077348 RepID=A0A2G8RUL4_9APHY|nr:hypothetical protein GSI_13078 [Ganoderma sinense ZZ0214-1]
MPPVVTQNTSSSNRRSTGSIRQRENRALVPAGTGSTRRRRSRSPDARAIDEAPPQLDIVLRRKKRSSHANGGGTPSSNAANMALVRTSVLDDSGDRGRIKPKPRSKALMWVDDEDDDIVTNIVHDNGRSSNAQNARSKRKERSRSRDAPHRNSRKAATPNESTEDEDDPMYTGPLAQAEYTRMKQEVETMRKQVAMAKKTIGRQSKVIDELRSELSTTDELHRSQRVEMEKLKRITKKSDDLIATMETNLTCQICMEILLKPYGLSPCGHVLCVTCLQGWFKNAPAGDDDMMDDDYPDALLYRKKTCPCCRAVVRSRPIPLYLVKSIASALDKSKAPAGAARPSPPPDDEDPWAGIFRDHTEADDYWSTDHDEDDEDEEDEDDEDEDGEDGEGYDDEDGYWSFDGYGTAEEDERYDGPYVRAQWAPPTVPVSQEEYPFLEEDAEEFSMLRRGVTLQMIELFQMSYCHNTGLCAMVDGENEVHLGFNIELHPDDETGEEYIDWVLADIYGRPERWRVENDHRQGTWSAWRLIPAEEVEEYDNTDSEVWADEMVDDDDM